MIRFCKILVLLLWPVVVNAQSDTDSIAAKEKWSLMVSAPNLGFIVPHTKQMTHLIQGHSFGFHTYYNKQLKSQPWHAAYNFPEHGADFIYIYTGNPKQLGHQLAMSYLLNLPLNRKSIDIKKTNQKHRFKNWFGLGLGAGYASRIWDLRENHQASVIGSHINIALTLQYSARIAQFEKAEIRAGLRITHFSNGAFQIPNLGTNNAGLFLTYAFKEKNNLSQINLAKPQFIGKKYRFSVFAGAGLKEIQPPVRKKYAAFSLSLLGEKRISYKSSLGIGGDLFYNSSIKTIQERKAESTIPASEVLQAGIALSYTLHFRDFELKMQQGFYLRDKYKLDGSFYNRFGLRYRINGNWFAQLTLKTHFAKADYGEWGLGYAF